MAQQAIQNDEPHPQWRDDFKFGEVVKIALIAHDEPAERFIAMGGHIKYYQRQKVVARKPTGRGRTGTYTLQHVCDILFALELGAMGLAPMQMHPLISRYRHTFRERILWPAPLEMEVEASKGRKSKLVLDTFNLALHVRSYLWAYSFGPAAADASDWIEWSGGECPVDPDDRIQFRCRDGVERDEYARFLNWSHLPISSGLSDANIIAYRILEAAPQQPEMTDGR